MGEKMLCEAAYSCISNDSHREYQRCAAQLWRPCLESWAHPDVAQDWLSDRKLKVQKHTLPRLMQ